MKTLFHCTRLDFVDNILKNGLVVQRPQQREEKHKGIYLSTYQFNWMWNTQRSGYYKGAVLKINVEGLILIKDYHKDSRDKVLNSKSMGKDFICLDNIEPERILELWIETEPNTFQKATFNKKLRG